MVGVRALMAAVLAIVIGITGCDGSSDPDRPQASVTPTSSPRPSAPPSIIIFPTQLPDAAGANALLRGVLVVRDGCLAVVSDDDGTAYPIIWPFGFDWREADDGVTVIGADGAVVGQQGEAIIMSGGEGPGRSEGGHCWNSSLVWYAFFAEDLLP